MTVRTTREDDSHAAHDVADSAREAAGTREAEAVKRRSAKGLDKGRRRKRVCCKEREDKTHLHPECGGEDCSSPSPVCPVSGLAAGRGDDPIPQSFLGQGQFSIICFSPLPICAPLAFPLPFVSSFFPSVRQLGGSLSAVGVCVCVCWPPPPPPASLAPFLLACTRSQSLITGAHHSHMHDRPLARLHSGRLPLACMRRPTLFPHRA